jgi:DNA polymerase III gamma/tau subunit
VAITTKSDELIEATEYYKKRYLEEAKQFNEPDVLRMLKIVNDAEITIKWSPQPRLKLEMVITQLASIDSTVKIQELISKIEELEKRFDSENFNNPPKGGNKIEPVKTQSAQNTEKKEETKNEAHSLQTEDISTINILFEDPLADYKTKPSAEADKPENKIENPDKLLNSIREKWDELADIAQSFNLNLATALKLSYPIELKNQKLKVGASNDIHLEWIKKNRPFIREKLKELFGVEFEIELGICDVEKFKEDVVKYSPDLKLKKLINESPFVKSLVENLGAKPID